MTAPSPIELFDCLHDLLHLFRTRTRQHTERLHPDLTLNEMRVLTYTGRNAGLTQKELTERSHTDKAQMARILTALESRGLLERTVSEQDKRIRCLRLSTKGEALFGELRRIQHEVAEELLKGLPVSTQKELLRSFRQASRKDG